MSDSLDLGKALGSLGSSSDKKEKKKPAEKTPVEKQVEKAPEKEDFSSKEKGEQSESDVKNLELIERNKQLEEKVEELKNEVEELTERGEKVGQLEKEVEELKKEVDRYRGTTSLFDEKNTELVQLRTQVAEQNKLLASLTGTEAQDSRLGTIVVLLDKAQELAQSERVSIITKAVKDRLMNLKYDDEVLNEALKDIDREAVEGRIHALKIVVKQEVKD